jgi:hypothetical protein
MRITPSLVLALAAAACSRGEQGEPRQPAGGKNVYQLISIGGEPVKRGPSTDQCSDRPYASWYVIRKTDWESVDSIAQPCGAGRSTPAVTQSGGILRAAGDTLSFFVADSTVGQKGLVQRGILRGDTLFVEGSEEEGGTYRYVRR